MTGGRPVENAAEAGRRLQIGSKVAHAGWEVLNVIAAPGVDHVGNANDLSRFEDGTFAEIYASHVLEHFDYKDELHAVLCEWRRVLEPGGRLYVSVPDLDTLARILLAKDRMTAGDQFLAMKMLFGGHKHPHDYHKVGFNQEILGAFLVRAGFVNLRRVQSFGLFPDSSNAVLKGIPISLNVIAERPVREPGGDPGADVAARPD